jgi:hypothetical protein
MEEIKDLFKENDNLKADRRELRSEIGYGK